jgi:purine-cytosine permease-like protein
MHFIRTAWLTLRGLGIVIIAIISWVVATFGIQVFHYYERSVFITHLLMLAADYR